jgi:TPR repeat protein
MKVPVLPLTGVIVTVLLSAASSIAGPLEDADAALEAKDYQTAVRLLRPLAEQGDAKAQVALGEMYAFGEGVPESDEQAAIWFRKAADKGDASAQDHLGDMHLKGIGVPRDYAQAVIWYRKSAEQGDTFGQLDLSVMYEQGIGVPQDFVQAYMWLNLAAAQGGDELTSMGLSTITKDRDELAAKMTPEQIAEAQRLAREWKPTK